MIMVRALLIFVIFGVVGLNFGVAQRTEADYCKLIQEKIGGDIEVSVFAGRFDILTDTHAYEVEWANNWKEAVGQSLWYGLQSNKKPAIILILKKPSDYKYLLQLNSALEYAELSDKIKVQAWPIDFQ